MFEVEQSGDEGDAEAGGAGTVCEPSMLCYLVNIQNQGRCLAGGFC